MVVTHVILAISTNVMLIQRGADDVFDVVCCGKELLAVPTLGRNFSGNVSPYQGMGCAVVCGRTAWGD